jgi:hypothetical protein
LLVESRVARRVLKEAVADFAFFIHGDEEPGRFGRVAAGRSEL